MNIIEIIAAINRLTEYHDLGETSLTTADLKELAAAYTKTVGLCVELTVQVKTFIKQCESEFTEDELKNDSVYQAFRKLTDLT
jgi:hypothetical protein